MQTKLLPLLMVVLVLPVFVYPKEKANSQKKPPALTDEEKEILKNREILDNLDLLQNFDKIQYFDYFAEKKADGSKKELPAKPAAQKDAGKEP
jgi:hypothetical protein